MSAPRDTIQGLEVKMTNHPNRNPNGRPVVRWTEIVRVLNLLGLMDTSRSKGEPFRVRRELLNKRIADGKVEYLKPGGYRLIG
jgi:hypothetical protein